MSKFNASIRFSNATLALSVAGLALTGCPDPQGEYDAFVERKKPFEVELPAGGGEAGGEAGTDVMIEQLPAIESGRFVFGLAPNLDPTKPMAFIADIVFELSEDRSEGKVISMTLDPRTCVTAEDMNQLSAGEGILYAPSEPPVIDSQGNFVADFGTQNVPGAANCISGSFIEAILKLKGRVVSEDAICGKVSGELILPFAYPLTGSTFAAKRLEGDSIVGVDVPGSCDDVLPMMPQGGAEAGAEAGTEAGAEAGTTAGMSAGAEAGTEAGMTAGAEAGTTAGMTAGAEAGMTAGAEAGTTAGMTAGVEAGTTAGMTAGAEAGTTAGAEAGTTAGAEAGTTAGAEAGTTAGAEAGMTAGTAP